ncbi:unnamed protein product, partial [Iphiclides podalirius]
MFPTYECQRSTESAATMRRYLYLNSENCKWCNMKPYVERLKRENLKANVEPVTRRPEIDELDIFDMSYYAPMQGDSAAPSFGKGFLSELLDRLPRDTDYK